MSIEKNIERIANALEKLVNQNETENGIAPDVTAPVEAPAPAPAANTPKMPAPPAPTPVAPAAPESSATPSTELPVVETEGMTPVELNEALVEEFNRLGRREPIDKALKKFGVSSINELDPSHYADVIAAVKKVKK